jgi:hypothetical protein
VLLRIYWYAQGRLETWVRSRLLKLNNKKVEIVSCRCFSVFMFRGDFFDCNNVRFSQGYLDVFDALGVTDDWYLECNETI